MKKIHLFLLLGVLLAACVKDKDEDQPIFVTDIVMPAEGTVFNPGDKVTIKARGFRENDRILLHGIWQMPEAPGGEGYYVSTANVTEMTATSLTFLAPGYYPPTTVEVKLLRSGDRTMTLGKISVADGRVPEEPQLYGIINDKSGIMGVPYAVERIDLETGIPTDMAYLENKSTDFSRVVGSSGSWAWGLIGIHTGDGNDKISFLDLSMRCWQEIASGPAITLGALGENGGIATIYKESESTLLVTGTNIISFTKALNNTPKYTMYTLPEGLKPEALSHYPCVLGFDGNLLLSADNGNGSFAPVVLDLQQGSGPARVGSSIKAAKLIPFWTVAPEEDRGTTKYVRAAGYALVLPNNGGTELRLLNTATMTLKEPFATFPQSARSIATLAKDMDMQKLYVLFDTERGRQIKEYDMMTGEWNSIGDMEYAYEEIVAIQ